MSDEPEPVDAVDEPELLYTVSDHVATITFNRPERMNTISARMLADLSERLLEADADRAVRAIVITGAGRAWCAGLDVSETASGRGLGDQPSVITVSRGWPAASAVARHRRS